jgi:single-strand DNA-binding protein
MTLNKLLIIGNAGSDPEMRYTTGGNAVTNFRVAVNHNYTTSNGERHEETEWFTVTSWNKQAENVNQYVHKGMLLYVEGRLKSSEWTDQDGTTRHKNEIIANQVTFLDKRDNTDNTRESSKPADDDDDDMPWT